jgi:hypothetical protein
MKRILLTALFVCAAAAAYSAAVPKPPAGLDTARKAFAAAMLKHDRAEMANMMKFPMAVESYGSPPKLSQKDFLTDKSYFDGWFWRGDPQLVDCLRTTKPTLQSDKKGFGFGQWFIDCPGGTYFFADHDGKWLFSGYENNNE